MVITQNPLLPKNTPEQHPSENQNIPQAYDEDGVLTAEFVRAVSTYIEEQNAQIIHTLVDNLHEADIADLIELLSPKQRRQLVILLGSTFNYSALAELDETVRDQLLETLPIQTIVAAIKDMESDDAVYLLEDMEPKTREAILARVPKIEREVIKRSLHYPENSAGRMMQTEYVAVPAFWNVGQTIDYMRTERNLPDNFTEIFVIDPSFHLLGSVPVSRILRIPRNKSLKNIMNDTGIIIRAQQEQEDVAYQFEQYHLISAPVTDEDNRIVGMITIDDVVNVIREEADQDIGRLGGVGNEEITDTVWKTTKNRFLWLLVNLATAILASWVISWFDATIEQMVALAILMPIVASMGGNAGTQTMTVAVRAIATRDLSPVNAMRVIARETLVGTLNGFIFAVITGLCAFIWFGSGGLGIVIGAAMIVNMIVAALAGILFPLLLNSLRIDPAIAASVFMTTITDVFGFFAFLGLAGLILI